MSFLCRFFIISCVLETFTPEHGGGAVVLRALDPIRVSARRRGLGYLGSWLCTLDQGRPGAQSEGKSGHRVSTSRTEEGKLASSGWEDQKDPLNFRVGGSPPYETLGPSKQTGCSGSLPVKRDEHCPRSRRIFTLAEWLVLQMDKTFPSLMPLPRSSGLCYGLG